MIETPENFECIFLAVTGIVDANDSYIYSYIMLQLQNNLFGPVRRTCLFTWSFGQVSIHVLRTSEYKTQRVPVTEL